MRTEQNKFQKQLHNYTKYLYEEEKHRTEYLNTATNTYLAFITFSFSFAAGVLYWLIPQLDGIALNALTLAQTLGLIGLAGAILLLTLALVFTVLVVKVRAFERLCVPEEFAEEASQHGDEEKLVNAITANYVVATERNFAINNRKTMYLAYALQSYITGFVLFIVSVAVLFFQRS